MPAQRDRDKKSSRLHHLLDSRTIDSGILRCGFTTKVVGAGTRIFPDGRVKHGEDVYVYSTSWRVTLPPFCFYPWTTVAPLDRDFSRAVSFRWNRTERRMLPLFLHSEVGRTVPEWGLQVLYKLALLCFVRGGRQPVLLEIASWHAQHERKFPLAELVRWVKSFAPVKQPKLDQVQWAQGLWAEIEGKKTSRPTMETL